ncbi:SgcJ/EcaC family oxidoreductase [Paenibacillus sp. GCM10027628]|uniref:SgcJ/EcaC family oxidoreductase n=1 Tax=Paenibacillus sp. GCM10027628 TaxID=3273413 RepID=UPI00364521F1
MSSSTNEDNEVRSLYHELLSTWNKRDAGAMAGTFAEEGELIGFDGSQVAGRAAIEEHLSPIFDNHPTAPFYGKIRNVRFLAPDVAVLRAVAGMVPVGQSDINPKLNTLHTMIAVQQETGWRIMLFQNTPAQFHGRPELVEALTEELRQLL